jgi:hypothetical protein
MAIELLNASVAGELLSKIPRLEAVARVIAQQDAAPPASVAGVDLKHDLVALKHKSSRSPLRTISC